MMQTTSSVASAFGRSVPADDDPAYLPVAALGALLRERRLSPAEVHIGVAFQSATSKHRRRPNLEGTVA